MLSGTPILKHPFELALYANVLHPNKEILPKDIQEFESLYINP